MTLANSLYDYDQQLQSITYAGDYGTSISSSLGDVCIQIGSMGISVKEAMESLLQLQEAFTSMGSRINHIEQDVDLVMNKVGDMELRPASNAKTENPNQKGDLEILNAIVLDEPIIKYSRIEWDDDGNMSIN